MTRLVVLVLISCLAASAFGQDGGYVPPENDVTTPAHPKPTDHPKTTTAKPITTTSPTTASPITHVTTPTTTTVLPNTTVTTTTTTTTVTPPTTNSPTTPTTAATTTTSKPPVPPKPTPEPVPPKPETPKVGVWQLNYTNSNVSCVLLELALQMKVNYKATNNKTLITFINLPPNANITGECSKKDSQSIELKWDNTDNKTDSLILNFAKNDTLKIYRLVDITISLTPDNKSFPGINDTNVLTLHHDHDEFRTTLSKSYRCSKKQELNLTDVSAKAERGFFTVSSLQFEVFHNSTNKQFTDVEDCAPSDTPDVIPIAVGCALAALVIIVLIAYLIGRRRGQARGYLSMFTETKQESDYIPMKNLSCFQ